MPAKKMNTYDDVDATPVKSFFVTMLTRDIDLADAILDLLDNCVDGILRTRKNLIKKNPYKDFEASITFNKNKFIIKDNCGGIPWRLHNYAFRMGRVKGINDENLETVGVYGIGMKRAIFKIGKNCSITTQNNNDCYTVKISPEWIENEEKWTLPVTASKRINGNGTSIIISNLYQGIADQFIDSAFRSDLTKKIQSHYALIINKGLKVKVNNEQITPLPIKLNWDNTSKRNAIRPFIYKTSFEEVDVFLAVGFTRTPPSQDEAIANHDSIRYSSDYAGWTIVCNDRVVAYCDKNELTGWGEAGVPQYHTQFIAISGIVEFKSNDASKLPMTTTKRGIDTSSTLYLQVKNKMREGMRLFIDYTNKWKKDITKSKEHINSAIPLSFEDVKKMTAKTTLTTVNIKPGGKQYKPILPLPPIRDNDSVRISFSKKIKDVIEVGDYLLDDPEANPSLVGEKCFNTILKEAKK